ncbi:hypothetical protein G6045_14030 [Streptomyces sp. YC504]|uniref:Uncharacterized protein n=1 Tax=Streptomyces mesophilus TaxID=1775132 RepID=A0A6G4XGU2_9ACTN|nr:hypothetical protein [Streptomyces mesophilus]NGO76776.1 hypothetical protein [Streptomyces mesophilus]
MTGPEHYLEAEELLDFASGFETGSLIATDAIARAQVHAALAHTAATALADAGAGEGMPMEDYKAWRAAAGVQSNGDAK